jgi:hypothetical protein
VNQSRTAMRVAATLFAIFALAHVWRLFRHIDVHAGNFAVPMWFSGVALIVAGALSIWLWTLSKE